LRLGMPTDPQFDRIRRRRMRYAERKLKEAQGRLARTERILPPVGHNGARRVPELPLLA